PHHSNLSILPSFPTRRSSDLALQAALTDRFHFGQILIRNTNGSFVLSHRDDEVRTDLQTFRNAEEAVEIAKYDDAGNYRSLKTADRKSTRLNSSHQIISYDVF